RQLVHRLVGERPAARHHRDPPRLVDVARHDADLALAGRDDAGAVGADETGGAPLEDALHAHHVEDGHALRDADDQLEPRVGRLHDGVGGAGGRDVDHRGVCAGRAHRLLDRVEDGDALEVGAAAPRRHARHHLRAVLAAVTGVELAGRPGDALGDDAGRPVDEHAHRDAAATALRAPSSMSLAVMMSSFESARIFFPCSTFVPSMRTTSGTPSPTSRAACTTPSASTSQRRMPPKMLMKIAFTAGSESRMRKAAATFFASAPPPTSTKLAGMPPAPLTVSMVAMARPAPFTMQPMLPSSAM